MKKFQVRDLMLSIDEYPRVSRDSTVYDAVLAMEYVRGVLSLRQYKPRKIFVVDDKHHVIGKIGQLEVLRGLEPGYREAEEEGAPAKLDMEFINALVKNFGAWQQPLENVAKRALFLKVMDIMEEPVEMDFVNQDESLDRGVNQLVACGVASLIVTNGEKAVGILRLSDVFDFMCNRIKALKV